MMVHEMRKSEERAHGGKSETDVPGTEVWGCWM
jgi:hypothetical protein